MNTLRNIIEMAKANPRWARIALALDATIGIIIGTVVYLLMNLSEVSASSVVVLLFGGILSIVGIITFGYSLFVTHGFIGDFDDDLDPPDIGEECGLCGQEWTGTL